MRRAVGHSRADEELPTCACAQRPGSVAEERRAFVKGALALGVGLPMLGPAHAADDAEKPGSDERPQIGDTFVFAEGDNSGKPISLADIPLDGPPVQAWPMDPKTKVVRDGSRLNQVLLMHLKPDELDDDTRGHSADGFLAYSSICAHAGCIVSMWIERAGKKNLVCPCHASTFDPRQQAEVVSGPAPRHLASLPVKIAGGVLTVGAPFIGKLGGAVSG